MKAYLKAKIEGLETNRKIKNIRDMYRGISDFKEGYQHRTNIVKDETGDLVTDTYSILASLRVYFNSYWMYFLSMILDRYKYTHQNN